MVRVAAVVVTYNRIKLLQQCIDRLKKQTVSCDILLVDNASTDGTDSWAKMMEEYHSNIFYRNTGANLGGAGGFNFGLRWATEDEYDYVWIMDDDCLACSDALEKLLTGNDVLGKKYGFQCSRVLWKDGSLALMNIPRQTVFKNVKINAYEKNMIPVAMASFVSLFLSTAIIKEVGLPYKEFFIWTDDWEFTRRISMKYTCYCNVDSVVFHFSQMNSGAKLYSAPLKILPRFYYLYRNDVYLYKREGLKGYMYELVRLSWHIFQVMLKSKNKWKRVKILLKGTIDGLSFKPIREDV